MYKGSIDLQSDQIAAHFESLGAETKQLFEVLSTVIQQDNAIAGQISEQIHEEMITITITLSQILSRLDSQDKATHDIQHGIRGTILKRICDQEEC